MMETKIWDSSKRPITDEALKSLSERLMGVFVYSEESKWDGTDKVCAVEKLVGVIESTRIGEDRNVYGAIRFVKTKDAPKAEKSLLEGKARGYADILGMVDMDNEEEPITNVTRVNNVWIGEEI